MRTTKIIFISSVLGVCALAQIPSSSKPAPGRRIVIAASAVLDGKGGVLHDTRIVIEGSKIASLDPKAEPIDYDLSGLTVLPGWIDAHVHITWTFSPDGKNAGEGATTQEAAYAAASNAWLTLLHTGHGNGFPRKSEISITLCSPSLTLLLTVPLVQNEKEFPQQQQFLRLDLFFIRWAAGRNPGAEPVFLLVGNRIGAHRSKLIA